MISVSNGVREGADGEDGSIEEAGERLESGAAQEILYRTTVHVQIKCYKDLVSPDNNFPLMAEA
jgi:hypothetical protein